MTKKSNKKQKKKAKAKPKNVKQTFPYGWFMDGQINMCKILMHNGARQTKCVNKKKSCKGCLILKSYTPMLTEKNMKQINRMPYGKLSKGK